MELRLVLPHEVANGLLGALVSITATCACVHPHDALLIGFLGSLVALAANDWLLRRQVDDPVGAVGVHGASAVWGLLAVGLFADGALPGIEVRHGLFRGGGLQLLGVQLLAAVCIVAWSCLMVPLGPWSRCPARAQAALLLPDGHRLQLRLAAAQGAAL